MTAVGLPYRHIASTPAFNAGFQLNHASDQIEFIFEAPVAEAITALGYIPNALTGTSPTYQISLQGVDATGRADGSIKASGNAKATFTVSTLNALIWATLTSSYTPSRGERLAAVISYSSGTISVLNTATFRTSIANFHPAVNQFPYRVTYDADTTTAARGTDSCCVAVQTASRIYGLPISTHATTTLSNPAERGLKFTLPQYPQYTVVGARIPILQAAGQTIDMTLYGGTDATPANSTGAVTELTVLQQVTKDTDQVTSAAFGWVEFFFDEATLTTLYANGVYRLVWGPSGASHSVYEFTVTNAGDLAAFGGGTNIVHTTRSGGNFTDTTTRRIHAELLIADIVAGGGPLVGGRLVGR